MAYVFGERETPLSHASNASGVASGAVEVDCPCKSTAPIRCRNAATRSTLWRRVCLFWMCSGIGAAVPGTGAVVPGTWTAVPGTRAAVLGIGAAMLGTGAAVLGIGGAMPCTGAAVLGIGGAMPGTGAAVLGIGGAMPGTRAAVLGIGGAMPGTGAAVSGIGGAMPGTGAAVSGIGGAMPGTGAVLSLPAVHAAADPGIGTALPGRAPKGIEQFGFSASRANAAATRQESLFVFFFGALTGSGSGVGTGTSGAVEGFSKPSDAAVSCDGMGGGGGGPPGSWIGSGRVTTAGVETGGHTVEVTTSALPPRCASGDAPERATLSWSCNCILVTAPRAINTCASAAATDPTAAPA